MANIVFLQHLRKAGHLREEFETQMARLSSLDRKIYHFVEGSLSRQLLRCAVQIVRWQKQEASEEYQALLEKFLDGLDQEVPHHAPGELEQLASWVSIELNQIRVMEHRVNEQTGADLSDLSPIVHDVLKSLSMGLAEGDVKLLQKTERLLELIDAARVDGERGGRDGKRPWDSLKGDVGVEHARKFIEWDRDESPSTDWGLGLIQESRESLVELHGTDTSDCLWILDSLEDCIELLQEDIEALRRFSKIEAEENPVYDSWIATGMSTQRAGRLCAIYSTLHDIEGIRMALFLEVTDFYDLPDGLSLDLQATFVELGMFLGDLEHLALRD